MGACAYMELNTCGTRQLVIDVQIHSQSCKMGWSGPLSCIEDHYFSVTSILPTICKSQFQYALVNFFVKSLQLLLYQISIEQTLCLIYHFAD